MASKSIDVFTFSGPLNWYFKVYLLKTSSPEVIEISCSTLLSMKFKLLLNTEIAKITGNFRIKSPKAVIYPANNGI